VRRREERDERERGGEETRYLPVAPLLPSPQLTHSCFFYHHPENNTCIAIWVNVAPVPRQSTMRVAAVCSKVEKGW
jgi:hypothetical protein